LSPVRTFRKLFVIAFGYSISLSGCKYSSNNVTAKKKDSSSAFFLF